MGYEAWSVGHGAWKLAVHAVYAYSIVEMLRDKGKVAHVI